MSEEHSLKSEKKSESEASVPGEKTKEEEEEEEVLLLHNTAEHLRSSRDQHKRAQHRTFTSPTNNQYGTVIDKLTLTER